MLTAVDADGFTPKGALIDEIVREGARRIRAAALEAEVNTYLAQLADHRDDTGRRLVVRNGYRTEPTVATAAGRIEVKALWVNDKRIDSDAGERHRLASAILLAWARKAPKVSEVLALLYLHGLSTGGFVPALELLGSGAGLSPATVSRLTAQWTTNHDAFARRDVSGCDCVYVWADGVHLKVRLEEAKACVLVLFGVRADGRKELIALDAGYRESSESWANLLRDCARRGMRAPVLAVGDGALGFWKAPHEVFPQNREQRCWVHKTTNVLDALPKSAQPAAKAALREIWGAEHMDHARTALASFARQYGGKFPKAVAKLVDDEQELAAFYNFPAEHWIHLRTTNPIESTFSTVRLRTKVTRSAGSRATALAMTFKLIESAQERWRAVKAPHLVTLVRAGARFERGVLLERETAAA